MGEKGTTGTTTTRKNKDELRNGSRYISNLDLLLPIVDHDHLFLVAIDKRVRQYWLLDAVHGESDSGLHPRGDALYGFKKEMHVHAVHQWLKDDDVLDNCGRKVLNSMDLDCWEFVTDPPFVPIQHDKDWRCIFAIYIYIAGYLERGKIPNFTQAILAVLRERAQLFSLSRELPE